jgi:hypothetical protein
MCMHIDMLYGYIYIYIYIYLSLHLNDVKLDGATCFKDLNIQVYMYIFRYIFMYIRMYIYIYIYICTHMNTYMHRLNRREVKPSYSSRVMRTGPPMTGIYIYIHIYIDTYIFIYIYIYIYVYRVMHAGQVAMDTKYIAQM